MIDKWRRLGWFEAAVCVSCIFAAGFCCGCEFYPGVLMDLALAGLMGSMAFKNLRPSRD